MNRDRDIQAATRDAFRLIAANDALLDELGAARERRAADGWGVLVRIDRRGTGDAA